MCIVMRVPATREAELPILTAYARCAGRGLLTFEMSVCFLMSVFPKPQKADVIHDATVRGGVASAGLEESLRGARESLSPMRPSLCGVACLSLGRILIVRPVAPNASSIWHV